MDDMDDPDLSWYRVRHHPDWEQIWEGILTEELQSASSREPMPTLLGLVTLLRKRTGVPWLTLYHFTQEYCERHSIQIANTADLPAPASLARASVEPAQEQQAVLLRPAEGRETPPEQLVRTAGKAE